MSRWYAALLSLLWFSLAHAEEAEQPMETSTIGVVVFVIVLIACVGVYAWFTWKNEKKSDDEKLGEKF
jgi:membrane protease YdiL (CAAX protease family)